MERFASLVDNEHNFAIFQEIIHINASISQFASNPPVTIHLFRSLN